MPEAVAPGTMAASVGGATGVVKPPRAVSPDMLYELTDVRQVPDEGFRRWFRDGYFDLIVWYDADTDGRPVGEPTGFQLCYDRGRRERAVTWRRSGSFVHERVDDGEVRGPKRTPVMRSAGAFAAADVGARFERESARIDPKVVQLVRSILGERAGATS